MGASGAFVPCPLYLVPCPHPAGLVFQGVARYILRMIQILKLTGAGIPQSWLSVEEAVLHYATGEVIWELGTQIATLHGGINALSGRRSEITVNSIIGVAGVGQDQSTRQAAPPCHPLPS